MELEKRIVWGRYPIGMGGVMRRRQLRVVGVIEDVSLQIREMQWVDGCC
jgi:hypothetical protein